MQLLQYATAQLQEHRCCNAPGTTRSCPPAESNAVHQHGSVPLGAALGPKASSQQLLPGARQQDAAVICNRTAVLAARSAKSECPWTLSSGAGAEEQLSHAEGAAWLRGVPNPCHWSCCSGKDGREGVQLEVAKGVPCTAYRAASEHRGAPPCRQHPRMVSIATDAQQVMRARCRTQCSRTTS